MKGRKWLGKQPKTCAACWAVKSTCAEGGPSSASRQGRWSSEASPQGQRGWGLPLAQPSIVLRGIQFRRLQGLSSRFVKPTGKDSSGDKDSRETGHDKFPTNSDGSANRPRPLGFTWQPSKPMAPAFCPSLQRLCAAVSALQCPSALLPANHSLTFLRKKQLPKGNCQKLINRSLAGRKTTSCLSK